MELAHNAQITDYPPERNYVRRALAISFGAHLVVVLVIGLIALIFHIRSLQQLMLEGGTIAQSGPAPEEKMEVTLEPEQPPPPPPDHVDFVRQIVKPKEQPVVVPPKVKPAPPKPVTMKPKYTAPAATGAGDSEAKSRLVAGSSGCPAPSYPTRAKLMHMTGEVVISIQFDGGGGVASAEVASSSGSGILDSYTRSFIKENWHTPLYAGRSVTVPVRYTMEGNVQ